MEREGYPVGGGLAAAVSVKGKQVLYMSNSWDVSFKPALRKPCGLGSNLTSLSARAVGGDGLASTVMTKACWLSDVFF